MNNLAQILTSAKDAFIAGEHEKVSALLLPITDNPNKEIAGIACYIAGLALYADGKRDRAIPCLQKAVDLRHTDPNLYANFGGTMQQLAQFDRAEEIYNAGIEACGRTPELLSHLATIAVLRGKLTSGEVLLKEALQLDGKDAKGWTNLGNICQLRMQYQNAITCYKEALEIEPSYSPAISNILLTSNYTRVPQKDSFEAHKVYGEKIPKPFSIPSILRSKNRKIKIGYLSGDFKTHSVAYFFAPLLENHSRDEFEIVCYSDLHHVDPVTLRLKESADHWQEIASLTDEDVIKMIKNDNIDILVDLAGHAGGRRVSVFRGKPAPVQVTYLGYPNSVGIPEMDYRIVDEITDPDGDEFYIEKLKRVASPFLCYLPASDIPDIGTLPFIKNGYITFGSFNNLSKLSDETVILWSKLLNEVENSRLHIKSKPLTDELTAEIVYHKFESIGISRDRIKLEGHRSSNRDHLEVYNEIDIALDCFPYNGTTTTCESLIMGVPLLTTLGDRHAARVSASILTSVGHEELVASDENEFIAIGKALSNDPEKLKELRSTLRNDVKRSPLSSGKRIAEEIEAIYREFYKS